MKAETYYWLLLKPYAEEKGGHSYVSGRPWASIRKIITQAESYGP
ncbi:Hypothetical protein Cul210932_0549 [Corynebacterium ulcerans]|nr:Hypothetical protein Cul210932_0549 [Corynebacterium ulcerans]ALD94281.1 Hypothetical protein Cul131001_0556 [Corynebacterium ulcerans]